MKKGKKEKLCTYSEGFFAVDEETERKRGKKRVKKRTTEKKGDL